MSLLIALGAGLLLVGFIVWRVLQPRSPEERPAPVPRTDNAPGASPPPAPLPATRPAAPAATAAKRLRALPDALRELQLHAFAELDPARSEALVVRLQTIPRPPHALDKLVSAAFLAQASSAELNELMTGEPQIAAKVLVAVNSPMYGLQKPLGSIGQAALYLGMNQVRQICMQHMLEASFRATSPALKARYEQVWNANALSGALCFRLAQLLKLPDPGGLVTQIVLSSLGPLAALALLPPQEALRQAALDPVARARAEQEALGLCATELGGLLMRSWKLPDSLIEDVCDIDRILHRAPTGLADARQARLGLCRLCNCIAEGLVAGWLADLRQFDVTQMDDPALFHLAAWLHNFRLERLPEFLHFPEVLATVDPMVAALRLPRPAEGL